MDRDGVSEVVAVAVGERDEIAALGLEFGLGALRVAAQERVDVDAFVTGVDPERRVSEPRQLCPHRENLENGALTGRMIRPVRACVLSDWARARRTCPGVRTVSDRSP